MRVLEGCKDSNRKENQKIAEIYRFDDVGSFEESVFASIPEGQVSFSVRYHEIVVQGGGRRRRLVLLEGSVNHQFTL
jgi:hypothetical protein